VVIRFNNSAATLPAVIAALRRQSVQPDLVLGVNNRSTDGSAELMRAAGANIIDWTQPYHHSRVLNFALRHCPNDLVLVLSSHTVLRSSDAIEKLVAAMADPNSACASAKWDEDPFYSDTIDWEELRAKGLKFGSIYSNSMGMLRRSVWEEAPFDETLVSMEDCDWALKQVKRGYRCRRVEMDFDYQRRGNPRHYLFAVLTFQLAARHGLSVAWLGAGTTMRKLIRKASGAWFNLAANNAGEMRPLRERLLAWLTWRFVHPVKEQ
jgi:GT2 family glycosyltransferase